MTIFCLYILSETWENCNMNCLMLHCTPPEHVYHFSEYLCSQVSFYLLSIEGIELQALIKDPFTL